jgi:amidophosphoribosyltransferase
MPAASELIANGKTDEQVQQKIGADWLIYQDLSDLIASAQEGNPAITEYECSVFDGKYVTGDVDEIYLRRLENSRSDQAKSHKKNSGFSKENNLIADLQE